MWVPQQQAPPGWTMGVGFVTKDIMSANLPPPSPDLKILVCGPPPMVKAVTGMCNEVQNLEQPLDHASKLIILTPSIIGISYSSIMARPARYQNRTIQCSSSSPSTIVGSIKRSIISAPLDSVSGIPAFVFLWMRDDSEIRDLCRDSR